MKISSVCSDGKLTVFLSGELDHHGARNSIPKISEIINFELPTKTILDFGGVTFMDSSGIALAIGIYKRAKNIGSDFSITNTSKQAYKVFCAAGISKIMKISCAQVLTTN